MQRHGLTFDLEFKVGTIFLVLLSHFLSRENLKNGMMG